MGIKFNLAELKKNKPLLYGMGAAGVLGLATLYRRKTSGGGGGGGTSTTAVSPAGATGAARYDSTGNDVANYLGKQNEFMSNQFNEWNRQIGDALKGIGGNGGEGTATARQQFYHPDKDATGKYKVTAGAEQWTSNIGTLAYAYGWTDPYKIWNDPANAALRQKYGNTLPTGNLAAGDIVYASLNPNADWKALFPDPYDKDPYGSAKKKGLVAP